MVGLIDRPDQLIVGSVGRPSDRLAAGAAAIGDSRPQPGPYGRRAPRTSGGSAGSGSARHREDLYRSGDQNPPTPRRWGHDLPTSGSTIPRSRSRIFATRGARFSRLGAEILPTSGKKGNLGPASPFFPEVASIFGLALPSFPELGWILYDLGWILYPDPGWILYLDLGRISLPGPWVDPDLSDLGRCSPRRGARFGVVAPAW